MITIRIEERLIYGNVVLSALKASKSKAALVVDDLAATTDKIMNSSLHIAVDSANIGCKLAIKTLKDAIPFVNDPRMKDMNVFCCTRKISDAYELVKNCPGQVSEINLVAYGYHDQPLAADDKVHVGHATLSKRDVEQLKELVTMPELKVYSQKLVSDKEEMMADILKEAGV